MSSNLLFNTPTKVTDMLYATEQRLLKDVAADWTSLIDGYTSNGIVFGRFQLQTFENSIFKRSMEITQPKENVLVPEGCTLELKQDVLITKEQKTNMFVLNKSTFIKFTDNGKVVSNEELLTAPTLRWKLQKLPLLTADFMVSQSGYSIIDKMLSTIEFKTAVHTAKNGKITFVDNIDTILKLQSSIDKKIVSLVLRKFINGDFLTAKSDFIMPADDSKVSLDEFTRFFRRFWHKVEGDEMFFRRQGKFEHWTSKFLFLGEIMARDGLRLIVDTFGKNEIKTFESAKASVTMIRAEIKLRATFKLVSDNGRAYIDCSVEMGDRYVYSQQAITTSFYTISSNDDKVVMISDFVNDVKTLIEKFEANDVPLMSKVSRKRTFEEI
jgi:hypothetical protein